MENTVLTPPGDSADLRRERGEEEGEKERVKREREQNIASPFLGITRPGLNKLTQFNAGEIWGKSVPLRISFPPLERTIDARLHFWVDSHIFDSVLKCLTLC